MLATLTIGLLTNGSSFGKKRMSDWPLAPIVKRGISGSPQKKHGTMAPADVVKFLSYVIANVSDVATKTRKQCD